MMMEHHDADVESSRAQACSCAPFFAAGEPARRGVDSDIGDHARTRQGLTRAHPRVQQPPDGASLEPACVSCYASGRRNLDEANMHAKQSKIPIYPIFILITLRRRHRPTPVDYPTHTAPIIHELSYDNSVDNHCFLFPDERSSRGTFDEY